MSSLRLIPGSKTLENVWWKFVWLDKRAHSQHIVNADSQVNSAAILIKKMKSLPPLKWFRKDWKGILNHKILEMFDVYGKLLGFW